MCVCVCECTCVLYWLNKLIFLYFIICQKGKITLLGSRL